MEGSRDRKEYEDVRDTWMNSESLEPRSLNIAWVKVTRGEESNAMYL